MSESIGERLRGTERRDRLLFALALSLFVGPVAGLGVVFHDGRSAIEGVAFGFALGALSFCFAYVRILRRLAEVLSLVR